MAANLYRFKYDEYGNTREILVYASGSAARSCSFINKGTAFSLEERRLLSLEATLPPGVRNLDAQVQTSRLKVEEKGNDAAGERGIGCGASRPVTCVLKV